MNDKMESLFVTSLPGSQAFLLFPVAVTLFLVFCDVVYTVMDVINIWMYCINCLILKRYTVPGQCQRCKWLITPAGNANGLVRHREIVNGNREIVNGNIVAVN